VSPIQTFGDVGNLPGDAASLTPYPGSHKKNFFFAWRCSSWRLSISSEDLIGDAVFLVEWPHFLRGTHLQNHPQAHIKNFFSFGNAAAGV